MSGYTQYYPHKRSFTENEWKKICEAFDFIYMEGVEANILAPYAPGDFKECGGSYGDAFGGYEHILFKAVSDSAHDSVFELGKDRKAHIGYCKTNRKPYDKYVTAILSIADYYAPGALEIDSDGYSICVDCKNTKSTCDKVNLGFGCWLPGILLATEVCGITHMPKGLEIELEE